MEFTAHADRLVLGDRHGVAVQSYNLAQALVAAGRPGQAVDLLDSVLVGVPENDAIRMRIGIVLGRAHQALGTYARALELAVDAAVRAHGGTLLVPHARRPWGTPRPRLDALLLGSALNLWWLTEPSRDPAADAVASGLRIRTGERVLEVAFTAEEG